MKALTYWCLGAVAICALHTQAQNVLPKEDTAFLRFNPHATNWVEGTITSVSPEGKVVMSGSPSAYAANYAEYHRQYYSYQDTQREMKRKELQDRYRDKMRYNSTPDYLDTFNVVLPNENFSIFDESPRYGINFDTWKFTEEPRVYHIADLKAGQRYVVGFDRDSNVLSMFRVNPIVVMSGENTAKNPVQPGHERNMVNGTHIMNLSSNETNPPPRIPNRTATNTTYTNEYGGFWYNLFIPPVRGTTVGTSVQPGTQSNQFSTSNNPGNLNPTTDTLPTNTPPNSSIAPTLPPNSNTVNSTATTPSTIKQSPDATSAQPNRTFNPNIQPTPAGTPAPGPARPLSPTPAPR
jgi:hypothetical protein